MMSKWSQKLLLKPEHAVVVPKYYQGFCLVGFCCCCDGGGGGHDGIMVEPKV